MQDVSKNEGRTVLFVSHQMDAIETLTQKCIYLKQGKIDSFGRTFNIINNYLGDHRNANDIISYTNRSGSGNAKIVKLEVYQRENRVEVIKQGEQFEVLIGIENRTSDKLDMSFVLENYKEQALFCSQLSDTGGSLSQSGYSEKKITVSVQNIRKGNYLVSLALFRIDKTEFHDVVLHFPLISIEGASSSIAFPQDDRWGDLYFPLNWY